MDFGPTVRHAEYFKLHIGAEDKEKSSEGGSLSDLKPAKPKVSRTIWMVLAKLVNPHERGLISL